MVFELGDVIPEWEVFRNGSGGEPCDSFVLDIDMDKRCFEVSLEGNPLSNGVESERAFLVKVDAQMAADPSFIKDRAKAMFFSSVL